MNENALNDYERLKKHCLFSTIDGDTVSDDTLTVFILNLLSLAKYLNDVVTAISVLIMILLNLQKLR